MAPLLLSGQTRLANVTLAWEPSSGAEIQGYRLYYGCASLSYTNSQSAGLVTEATIPNLLVGTTYFFAATAVDADGFESDYSVEVRYTIPGGNASDPQLSLAPGQSGRSIALKWELPTTSNLTGVRVRVSQGSAVQTYDLGLVSRFEISELELSTTYAISISGMAADGSELFTSGWSEYTTPGEGYLKIGFDSYRRLVFTAVGTPGRRFQIMGSADKVYWEPVGLTTIGSNGIATFSPGGAGTGMGFYRLEPLAGQF